MATVEEPTQLVVSLTERAAAKIRELQAEEPEGDASVLRVAVQGGGCSGFEYALGFDRGPQEGDHELELHGVRSSSTRSARRTSRARASTSSTGSRSPGFKIENPNVSSACGCGHSFQVDDGDARGVDGAVERLCGLRLLAASSRLAGNRRSGSDRALRAIDRPRREPCASPSSAQGRPGSTPPGTCSTPTCRSRST